MQCSVQQLVQGRGCCQSLQTTQGWLGATSPDCAVRSLSARRNIAHFHRTTTGDECAKQVLHKAPISEPKQVEHVVNEREAQQAARHPLCVALHAAFQDSRCLYLLQEFVPGA